MAYGNLNVDTITGSGASSVIVNNGTNNVCGFTTGNNLQMLQNGGGIVFSNSSATTNSTLNDYETGTWTPTYTFAGGNGTASFTTSLASYTKIGNTVSINLYFDMTIGTASGAFSISNIPFTSSTRVPCSLLWDGGGSASNVVTADLNTTTIAFNLTPQSSSYSTTLAASNMNSHPYPRLTITYKTTF